MGFENNRNNNKSRYNSKKKMLAEIRRQSISFIKEYFDFFEDGRYLDGKELQRNYNPNKKEDLNDKIFTMFLFFMSSFILYTFTVILIQFLKSVFFPDLDVLQDLTEIMSQYSELTTRPHSDSLNSDNISRDSLNELSKGSNKDFENFQKKFKVFEFLGIEVK